MAFLVCYSQSPPDDHAREKALYLDQQCYELIFAHCRAPGGRYPILREIAMLGYKAPTLVVAGNRSNHLEQELIELQQFGLSHAQLDEFRVACREAVKRECALTISGDMYPELGGDITRRRRIRWWQVLLIIVLWRFLIAVAVSYFLNQ
jgi:hypothetical protein